MIKYLNFYLSDSKVPELDSSVYYLLFLERIINNKSN